MKLSRRALLAAPFALAVGEPVAPLVKCVLSGRVDSMTFGKTLEWPKGFVWPPAGDYVGPLEILELTLGKDGRMSVRKV